MQCAILGALLEELETMLKCEGWPQNQIQHGALETRGVALVRPVPKVWSNGLTRLPGLALRAASGALSRSARLMMRTPN